MGKSNNLKQMETNKTLKSFEPLGNEGGVSNRIASWFQVYHMYTVPPPPLFLSLLKEDNIQNIKMEYLDSRLHFFLQNVEQDKWPKMSV